MDKKQLKALTKKWYAKLAKSGFTDIEQSPKYLKQYDNEYYKERYTPLEFENKQEYFTRARHFLLEHNFATEKERRIWEMHCEGLSLREIRKKLRIKQQHHHVGDIINRLKELMLHGNSSSEYN